MLKTWVSHHFKAFPSLHHSDSTQSQKLAVQEIDTDLLFLHLAHYSQLCSTSGSSRLEKRKENMRWHKEKRKLDHCSYNLAMRLSVQQEPIMASFSHRVLSWVLWMCPSTSTSSSVASSKKGWTHESYTFQTPLQVRFLMWIHFCHLDLLIRFGRQEWGGGHLFEVWGYGF